MSQSYSPVRRHRRHAVDLTVVCASLLRRLPDRAVNVSRGGACIKTSLPLVVGSRYDFLFIVPGEQGQGTVASVCAVIAWVSHDAMGLWFDRGAGEIAGFLTRLEAAP